MSSSTANVRNSLTHAQYTRPYRVIVLPDADNLTDQGQAALRRIMEQHGTSCRFILCARATSRLIDAIQSRCMPIRVPAPTPEDMRRALQGIQGVSADDIENVIEESDRNMCVAFKRTQELSESGSAQGRSKVLGWKRFLNDIAGRIRNDFSARNALTCRQQVNELLRQGLSATIILRTLAYRLCTLYQGNETASAVQHALIRSAAHYERCVQRGQVPLVHIDAFMVSAMETFRFFK
jgi:replication factor C subunit 3/5